VIFKRYNYEDITKKGKFNWKLKKEERYKLEKIHMQERQKNETK